jgi:hypothetical protein
VAKVFRSVLVLPNDGIMKYNGPQSISGYKSILDHSVPDITAFTLLLQASFEV